MLLAEALHVDRFTLYVMNHVDESCITLDDRLLATIHRMGDVDDIEDAKLKPLFKEVRVNAEGQVTEQSQFERMWSSVEKQLATTASSQAGTSAAWVDSKTVLRAVMLSQLERCARRLKQDQALLAPHCIEANPETFKLIYLLLCAYPVSSVPGRQGKEDNSEDATTILGRGYVPLALLRLLTINLRQAARQATGFELGPELLGDLRSVLLKLVGECASSDGDAELVSRAQEEAVCALRAGTPVLFNDPAELVGLLDVMLQKRSDHVASPSEVQFMAMLLSYLAKPPVIWRVLMLSSEDSSTTGAATPAKQSQGDAACMRLFRCLLGHLLQHCEGKLKASAKEAASRNVPESADGITSACIEVLDTAWRLQHARWTSAIPNKESTLQLSIHMTNAFIDHSLEVSGLITSHLAQGSEGTAEICEECLKESAIGSLLPDVFAVVSQMPADLQLLSRMTQLLAVLDTVAASLPSIAVASLSLKDQGTGMMEENYDHDTFKHCADTMAGLMSQKIVGEHAAESKHPYVGPAGERREVTCLQGAAYLLLEFSEKCSTSCPQDWVQVEDGFGNVMGGRFWGSTGWPKSRIIVPGDSCVLTCAGSGLEAAMSGSSWGYHIKIVGYATSMFTVDCWEVFSTAAHVEGNNTNLPLYLPDSVVFTQVSFDPRDLPTSSAHRLSVRMGDEVEEFTTRQRPEIEESDVNTEECFFPSVPLTTVNPNITFGISTDASSSGSDEVDASNEAASHSARGWKAMACCIGLSSSAEPHWLVEALRLLACVSAQLAGTLVAGSPPKDAEIMCKQWLTSDLLKTGQLKEHEVPTTDIENEGFSIPQRPHPLRHHPALDRLEKACTAAMLHHLNLLDTVRAHGDAPWGDEAAGLIPVLKKVGMCANKVRWMVMQQRDQLIAVQSVPDEAGASTKDVTSYDDLVKPYIERARLLLRFVPAYGRQANPRTPSKSHGQAASPINAANSAPATLSPSQRWQRAALRVVGEKSPSKSVSSPTKSAVKRQLLVDVGAAHDSKVEPSSQGADSAPSESKSQSALDEGAAKQEDTSAWKSLLPWFRVHHAYWKVKHRTMKQEEVVADLVHKFIASEITADLLADSMRSREQRATEVEAGLMCLTTLLRSMRTRVGRAEVLQALLVSNWSMRHYLEDIRASTAPALGRVRALFNDLERCLLDVLKGPSSSCQLRGYAANALAMVYDAADLDYLSLIGMPQVLHDFVESGGASIQLAGPSSAPNHEQPSMLSVRQVPFPAGAMWHGVFKSQADSEMSMCITIHKNIVGGTGTGAFSQETDGPAQSPSSTQSNFVVRGEMIDQSKIRFEALCKDGGLIKFEGTIAGKKMEGMWVRGSRVGSFTLHRTKRAPLHPTAFSRVNKNFICFEGRTVVFTGTNQIGVVQAEKALTASNPYFEVQVVDKGRDCAIAVGVAHREYPLDQMPGWRNGSIAYHMDDGKLFFQRGQGARFGDKCGQGDVVGCGVELSEKGDQVVSVYWTKNGELVGRELCASSLQLPLYASVALHSQGEKVMLFEAPPPPLLGRDSIEFVNSNGQPVRLGTDRSFTHLYYCGQRVGVGRLPGSDGTCGPNNGPQCSACETFQEMMANRIANDSGFGENSADGVSERGGGVAEDCNTATTHEGFKVEHLSQHALACQAVWRLLRVMLLQVTEQDSAVNSKLAAGLWGTVLLAIKSLAVQAGRPLLPNERRTSCVTVTGRQCYDEDKFVVSSSAQEVANLESSDQSLSWTSSGVGRRSKHWMQFNMRNEVALSYIGMLVNKEDGDLCPRKVEIMAGEDEASLRAITEVHVNPVDLNDGVTEVVLLHEPEEAHQVYRVCLDSQDSNVRVRGLVVRGVIVRDQWSSTLEQEEANIIKRVEVSTNKCAKRFLTDGRPDTFWQSDGRSGQHWVRLYVEPDALVTGLAIQVHAGDGNYCPSLVDVLAGDTPTNIKRVRTCSLSPSGNQRCVLLEKCKQSYKVVQVNIRENNGGCDCKVRGIFLTGHFAPKRSGVGGGSAANLLQDLLSTAHAASRSTLAAGIGASSGHTEWMTHLLRLLELPSYSEQTRTKALSLLLRLCHAWGAKSCLNSHPQLIETLLDALAHSSAASSVMRPLSLRHWAPMRSLRKYAICSCTPIGPNTLFLTGGAPFECPCQHACAHAYIRGAVEFVRISELYTFMTYTKSTSC
jgi:hypothetical protein